MTGNTLLSTRSGTVRPVFATNQAVAGTAVAQPVDTATTPAQDYVAGYIDFGFQGAYSANALWLKPYGTNTAAQTFLMGVFGVDEIPGDNANVRTTWTHSLIASFTCTLGTTCIGLANSLVNASQFYCDTITILVGNANVSVEIISPTSNRGAQIKVDVPGHRFAFVNLFLNGSSTGNNTLFRSF